MFSLGPARLSRKPSLTPMIDVVFLLLVFFMLAARFGQDMALPVSLSGTDTPYAGPPRLVAVLPDAILLNGVAVTRDTMPDAVRSLMTKPDDAILVQPRTGTDVQRLVDVIQGLQNAGFSAVVVVE